MTKRLSDIVPAGCHTYSKGDECFPANAPEYLVRGDGCRVIDSKGKKYIDWGMGLRSVMLGHSFECVNHAVIEAVMEGTNFCRPTLYEQQLAELLVKIIPCAEMVKFGKSGSDVTSAAVKLARAYTDKDLVYVAKENPFISQHDWFIGTTATNGGIPRDETVRQYSYSNLLEKQFDLWDENDTKVTEIEFRAMQGNLAAIVLDPATVEITKEKLEHIWDICTKYGAVFILDEMISGFRYNLGGVQSLYGVTPDLSTFGKAIANGFSTSALCGKREIMQLGDREFGNVFLLSGTYNAETPALAAAISNIEFMMDNAVVGHTNQIGRFLVRGIRDKIKVYGLEDYMSIKCHGAEGTKYIEGANPSMSFRNMETKTIFDQHMIECGILMPYIAPSYSHTLQDVERTILAADYAMKMLLKANHGNNIHSYIMEDWVEKPVFRKSGKV